MSNKILLELKTEEARKDLQHSINLICDQNIDLLTEREALLEKISFLENRSRDEEMADLKEKLREANEKISELKSQIFWGFTEEDNEKIHAWNLSHRPQPEGRYKLMHSIKLEIQPTGLGPIKTAYCSCGEKLDLTKESEFG